MKNSETNEIASEQIRTTMLRTGWLSLLLLLCFTLSAEAQLTEQRARVLAEGMATVFSTGDMQMAVATFDPLIRVRSPVLPQEAVGIQNLAAFIRTNRMAFPDLRVRIKEVFINGNDMAVSFSISGTNTGTLGQIPATGRVFAIDGMARATVENDKILEWRDYWNALELFSALGVPIGEGQTDTAATPPGH